MRGRKGAAHFEMIISFVFFAGFIFFLFMVLEPQDTKVLPDSVIAGLYDSLKNNVSINLSSVFLRANYDVGDPNCFRLVLPDNVFSYPMVDDGSRVFNLKGDVINSNINGNNLYIENKSVFFEMMFSSEFEDGAVMTGCGDLINYELGGVLERRVFSYAALEKMREDYFNDNDELMSRLRVPSIFSFAIVFENLHELSMEPVNDFYGGEDVVARDYLVEILTEDGGVINERVIVKVW